MKRVFTPVKKKTILIVDDDEVVLQIYREIFLRQGIRVEIASDSEGAMARLKDGAVDLLVLDLCLPAINGIETLKNIRAHFSHDSLPIIAAANPYLTSLIRAAAEAGATKCVAKSDHTPDQVLELACALLLPGQVIAPQVQPQSQEQLVAKVLCHAPEVLAKLRAGHQNVARTEQEDLRLTELGGMHRQIHSLVSAGLLGFRKISQMTNALEALLIELQAKPRKITPSVIRTVAQALDVLATLFDHAAGGLKDELPRSKILVVDDEIISRQTICSALERAGFVPESLDDSHAARLALEAEHFDLIFLDVEMPGLTGFELCVKIREMVTNRATPVVFVTAHSDFGSRAQSALSGGNDFIAKPFLSVELTVKALTCLFRESPRAVSAVNAQNIAPVVMHHPALSAEQAPVLQLHC